MGDVLYETNNGGSAFSFSLPEIEERIKIKNTEILKNFLKFIRFN
jgi:hypothetical protein